MKTSKFEDFVKLANFFYSSIGMEAYEKHGYCSRAKTLMAASIFYIGIINLNIIFCCEIIFVVMALSNGNNFLEATMTMSYIGFVLVGDIKMCFVGLQKKPLTKFVKDLQKIYPINVDQQQQQNLQYYLRQCLRITMSFSLLYMVLIWTYNLFSIVEYLIYYRWLNLRVVEQSLPYFMYAPWDWHNHWSYYVLYAFQNLAGYTSAAGQISSDLFLSACVTQIIMHFDYLAKTIANYKLKQTESDVGRDEAFAKDMDFLRITIKYHTYLLDLTEQVNNVFGVPLLLNFATSSFVICFVGFQITIGASPETVVKLVLFLFSSMVQVYLICHYGQQLMDASLNVANAVYNQNWSNADVRYKKMLILMGKRAQKPAQLKATTFVLISRNTMTELMQLSYKFYALLRTMYVRQT